MKHTTRKCLSLLLITAILIGILTAGAVSVGAETFNDPFELILDEPMPILNASSGDRFYYSYTPDRDMTVSLEATGDFDTFVQLYDTDYQFLAAEDNGGDGFNFRMISRLTADKTYIFIVYCNTPYTGDVQTEEFSICLSKFLPPENAKELTVDHAEWTHMTENEPEEWYTFTADQTNNYTIQSMGFEKYLNQNGYPDYTIGTRVFDETMTEVKPQSETSWLGISEELIDEKGFLLKAGKKYYISQRLATYNDTYTEMYGKMTISYYTVDSSFVTDVPQLKKNVKVSFDKESDIGNSFDYYAYTPKRSGTYVISFNGINCQNTFMNQDGYYTSAFVEVYNSDRRLHTKSYVASMEDITYHTAALELEAGQTYYFCVTVAPGLFVSDSCSFTLLGVYSMPYTYLLGDVDDNDAIESVDATLIQRRLSNIKIDIPYEELTERGDVDGNGEAEVIDATLIQRHLASITLSYPIGETIEVTEE